MFTPFARLRVWSADLFDLLLTQLPFLADHGVLYSK